MDNLKPSKKAEKMLLDLHMLSDDENYWLQDMCFGIASTMETITSRIENPPKEKPKGCTIIHAGFELFIPIKELKQQLVSDKLGLVDYITSLDLVVEDFSKIVEKNYEVMSNSKVRSHMKNMANVIVIQLEAGAVLNSMFRSFEPEI